MLLFTIESTIKGKKQTLLVLTSALFSAHSFFLASGETKTTQFLILLGVLILWLITTLVSYELEYIKKYFKKLSFVGFFLTIQFAFSIHQILRNSEIPNESGYLSYFLTTKWIFIIYIMLFISLQMEESKLLKKTGFYILASWIFICLVFTNGNSEEFTIRNALALPAKRALFLFGRGALRTDIILNKEFCLKTNILPATKKCDSYNYYSDVLLLLDINNAYVQFPGQIKIEIDKKDYAYLAVKRTKEQPNLIDFTQDETAPIEYTVKPTGPITTYELVNSPKKDSNGN